MSSDRTSPPEDPRYSPAQRRLLHALAGLVVAALAGGAFVLTYDVLRDVAVEGGAGRRWAPVYPAMADGLTVLTLLSLVVTRHARWWTRWPRWTLLLALIAGTAALSAHRTVRGPGALPDEPLRAGVAVAPHVLLVIAIWLWLTMFKQIRAARPAAADAPSGSRRRDREREREHVKTLKPLPVASLRPGRSPEALEAPEGPPGPFAPESGTIRTLPPALLPTDVELVRHGERAEEPDRRENDTRPDLFMPLALDDDEEAAHDEPEQIEAERTEAEQVEAERAEAERIEAEQIEAERIQAERAEAERIQAEQIEAERAAHDEPERADEPQETGGGRHRLRERPDGATDPDIPLPGRSGAGDEEEGDGEERDWDPPSGSFRSSPVPPAE